MAIWVFKDGVREGPYEERDIRELIYEGTYRDSDEAIRDGDPAPRTVGEILGRVPGSLPLPVRSALGEAKPTLPPHVHLPVPAVAAAAVAPPPLPAGNGAEPAVTTPPGLATPLPTQVSVVDFSMPFGSVVVLMVKWALAAIPAFLILATVGAICWMAVVTFAATLFASLLHHH